jgi:hypothetical protein
MDMQFSTLNVNMHNYYYIFRCSIIYYMISYLYYNCYVFIIQLNKVEYQNIGFNNIYKLHFIYVCFMYKISKELY